MTIEMDDSGQRDLFFSGLQKIVVRCLWSC
jgi:hypothetical protein